MNYLITRHPSALQWLELHIQKPYVQLSHLHELNVIQADDCIYGILPIDLAASVAERGAHYFYLNVDIPKHLRGQELSIEQIQQLNPKLEQYRVIKIGDSL